VDIQRVIPHFSTSHIASPPLPAPIFCSRFKLKNIPKSTRPPKLMKTILHFHTGGWVGKASSRCKRDFSFKVAHRTSVSCRITFCWLPGLQLMIVESLRERLSGSRKPSGATRMCTVSSWYLGPWLGFYRK